MRLPKIFVGIVPKSGERCNDYRYCDTETKDMTFELFDVTGKVVASKALNGAKTTLACGELQTGTYFYRVVNASGSVKNGSVSIVR
jgi:hypothetical protein